MNTSEMFAKKAQGALFPPPFKPYDYQIPIVKIVIEAILKGLNGLIVQPTATGKSTESAFIARSCILLHDMKGIYLYDENDGLIQARKSFEHIFGKNQIKCANFFGYNKKDDVTNADIVFASFQLMNNYHERWYKMFDQNHFDFMIVNEAHHGQAVTYRSVIEHFTCPRIGMTGTPERMDGLDILEIFDRVLVDIPLEEAIAKNWISPIEYHVLGHNLSSKRLKEVVRQYIEEGKKISIKQINESIFIDELDTEMLSEVYKFSFPEDDSPRQTKIFCENIVHANRIVALLKKDGHTAEVAHSKMGPSHNSKSLEGFRQSTTQFLVSVDKYNEDIDIPSIEVVVFFRTTDSKTVFLQQLGRGLRKGKPKLYALDFVGNAERMVMLSELEIKIQEYTENGSLIDKHTISLESLGFELRWHGYSPDVLKLIQAITLGKYKTWQEAGEVAVKSNIRSCTSYEKNYKRIDLRLPAAPYNFYKDFPGWDTFLNREVPPKNWLNLNIIIKSNNLHTANKTATDFIESVKSKNPEWIKNCTWKERTMDYYHPKLASLIIEKFKANIPAPNDWKTAQAILRSVRQNNVPVSIPRIITIVAPFRESNPKWFKMFLAKSDIKEHYHPLLVKLIVSKLSEKEYAPQGWLSIKSLCLNNKWFLKVLLDFIKPYRTTNPAWFGNYCAGSGQSEHVHPDFARIIIKEIPNVSRPKPGWKTLGMLKKSIGFKSKILRVANSYKKSNREWFKYFYLSGEFIEHYHPDLVKIVENAISELETKPSGWMTCYSIGLNYGVGIKWTRVKKIADNYRVSNPDWFKFFIAGPHLKEHYHPNLVRLIENELSKMKLAPIGWSTASKLSKSKYVKSDFDGIKIFAETFKQSNPDWFKLYITKNVYIEHYHPDLVKLIVEKFKKD